MTIFYVIVIPVIKRSYLTMLWTLWQFYNYYLYFTLYMYARAHSVFCWQNDAWYVYKLTSIAVTEHVEYN